MPSVTKQLERLKNTADHRERNTLALALAETGDPRVRTVLVALVDRPELADHRGTLVHCVGKFDCSDQVLWLAKLVCQGNWEVAHEAFDILADIDTVTSEQVAAGFDLLSRTLDAHGIDAWRARLIQDLLSMFD